MNKDKKVLYVITLAIFAVLLALMFVKVESSRMATAIVLIPLAVLTRFVVKKRTSASIYKREVLLLVTVVGAIFIVLLHMSGIYFGYYKNPYFVSSKILLNFILPITSIIVTTELIRATILAQKNKFSTVMCFLSCVLIEMLMVSGLPGITTFNRFMDVVGLALFPAVSANIYYHYSAKHFGMLPNIVFRAITTLYVYFIPTAPAIPDALMSCIKIFLPLLMLALLASLYEKKKKDARQKRKHWSKIPVALTAIFVISVTMLISCQFRFGAIVIATESMTGEINKGDMIIYERYDGQPIKEGQVIVFLENKSKVIHRVVEIEKVGEETRYYTKGDANPVLDSGYRTEADIFGLTDVKVAYLGYPTLWLRQLINNIT